jgi:hypothetical protein
MLERAGGLKLTALNALGPAPLGAHERLISLWGTLCHHVEWGGSRFIPSPFSRSPTDAGPDTQQLACAPRCRPLLLTPFPCTHSSTTSCPSSPKTTAGGPPRSGPLVGTHTWQLLQPFTDMPVGQQLAHRHQHGAGGRLCSTPCAARKMIREREDHTLATGRVKLEAGVWLQVLTP